MPRCHGQQVSWPLDSCGCRFQVTTIPGFVVRYVPGSHDFHLSRCQYRLVAGCRCSSVQQTSWCQSALVVGATWLLGVMVSRNLFTWGPCPKYTWLPVHQGFLVPGSQPDQVSSHQFALATQLPGASWSLGFRSTKSSCSLCHHVPQGYLPMVVYRYQGAPSASLSRMT